MYNKHWVLVPEKADARKAYGPLYEYRNKGASEAARYGATAALIRSITPYSIGSWAQFE